MARLDGVLLRFARMARRGYLVLIFSERHGFVVGLLGEDGELRDQMTHEGVDAATLDFETRSELAAVAC